MEYERELVNGNSNVHEAKDSVKEESRGEKDRQENSVYDNGEDEASSELNDSYEILYAAGESQDYQNDDSDSSVKTSPEEDTTGDTEKTADTKSEVQVANEIPISGGTYNAMYGPDAGPNNDILQGIPGLPSEKLLESRHDIISVTSIVPIPDPPYEGESNCYFLSSSQQIFTVVESVVHYLTQPVVNFIRGEWIVSFMPFPIAQHICISLDDGVKRYEEVLKVEPAFDNPTKVELVTVEHRLVSGNTMHRPRFKEALRQSLGAIGKQICGETPWEIFVSRASGRALGMDSMIHSFLSESHEPLETHCSPLVEHVSTSIQAKLTAAPYSILGKIFRPTLRHASWLVVSSHYQLHETISLNLNFKARKIEATSLDSSLARSSYTEDIGPSVVLLDAVSYVSDALTGNAVISGNTLLGSNLHPFINFDCNPIFNRGTNPCFNATFAPPSNSAGPVNSVGLIITPPSSATNIASTQHHQQFQRGNFSVMHPYPPLPAPLYAYSPYGLLQQVVPPIPIPIPENYYSMPSYAQFVEVQGQGLILNPNAQDFYPDHVQGEAVLMSNDGNQIVYGEHVLNHGIRGLCKQSSSDASLQISHQNGAYSHRSPSAYDSEPPIVMIRAAATAETSEYLHSKSWSEETEGVENDGIDCSQYPNSVYDEQPLVVETGYNNYAWKSSCNQQGYHEEHNNGCNTWPRHNADLKYGVKTGQQYKYDELNEPYQHDSEYASQETRLPNNVTRSHEYNPRYRNDHYTNRAHSNYYSAGNKPRYSHSNTSDRYIGNGGNDSSHYSNYSTPERGGHFYGRSRGRGRGYHQKSHYSQNYQNQSDGSYYRRDSRFNSSYRVDHHVKENDGESYHGSGYGRESRDYSPANSKNGELYENYREEPMTPKSNSARITKESEKSVRSTPTPDGFTYAKAATPGTPGRKQRHFPSNSVDIDGKSELPKSPRIIVNKNTPKSLAPGSNNTSCSPSRGSRDHSQYGNGHAKKPGRCQKGSSNTSLNKKFKRLNSINMDDPKFSNTYSAFVCEDESDDNSKNEYSSPKSGWSKSNEIENENRDNTTRKTIDTNDEFSPPDANGKIESRHEKLDSVREHKYIIEIPKPRPQNKETTSRDTVAEKNVFNQNRGPEGDQNLLTDNEIVSNQEKKNFDDGNQDFSKTSVGWGNAE